MANQIDNTVNVVDFYPGTLLMTWDYLNKYFEGVPVYEGNPLETQSQTQSYIICPYCGGRIEP